MKEDRQKKLEEAKRILETLTEEEIDRWVIYLEQLKSE